MKGTKATAKPGRPSFFDRIKMKETDSKEDVDLNHIRQSSYKLQRTKSHRKGHSLQRKIPIMSPHQVNTTQQRPSLREIVSEQNTLTVVPNEFTVRFDKQTTQPNHMITESEEAIKSDQLGRSFRDLFQILQLSKQNSKEHQPIQQAGHSTERPMLLEEEQEILELVKVMWDTTSRMKMKKYFKDQLWKIEDALKSIVLKLAKPKLQILEEGSSFSLKVPPFKYSSPDNFMSFKEESKYNSIQHFQITEKDISSLIAPPQSKDEEKPAQELQIKKIMYILEDTKKVKIQKSRNVTESSISERQESQSQNLNNVLTLFNEGATKPMRNNNSKSHLSSFNGVTERTNGPIVYEQQKINKSYSNDRLYLKNIVKKAKGNLKTANENINNKENLGCGNELFKDSSKSPSMMTSGLSSKVFHQKSSLMPSISQDADFSQSNCLSMSVNPSQERHQQSQGDSKRKTLNNIVNMLNKKYNKNILLQPRKPVTN